MKPPQTFPEKVIWVSARTQSSSPQWRASSKLLLFLLLIVLATYAVYLLTLVFSSHSKCNKGPLVSFLLNNSSVKLQNVQQKPIETGLEHIFFGIAASSDLWERRKEYIKLWWRPENRMRGIVWLDRPVNVSGDEIRNLPELKISSDTSNFAYKNKQGHRSAIRISRIVSESLRFGKTDNVRWFVMVDDDTVMVPENLMRILKKYDHNQFYYIGSSSESHLQNINFSYNMAYGGGGFAISFPLAVAIEKMQDRCIQRYPSLYGSDDRMQACMAELGVPLTKELGFHQYDVYGNLFGLLAAHPVTPLISLHHIEVVEPIFPNMTTLEALKHLQIPMKVDSAGLMQQSICYDRAHTWSVSVSWGFAVQIYHGVMLPRELEMTSRSFLNWYRRADYTAYAFNTRPVARSPCQKPFVFYMSKTKETVSEYILHNVSRPICKWKTPKPDQMQRIKVYKKPDPHLWDRSPRRNCCRIMRSSMTSMEIDVGLCGEDEVSQI